MPGYTRLCPVMPGYVWLGSLMSRCRVCPATALRDASGPTLSLSRAAERAMMKRHGHTKEYVFVNSGWRRRLQAMLGRGMADDGPSAHPTVSIAET